jgi:predicted solute-binding protein
LIPTHLRPRLAAVSYLNTVPLIWGMKHGPQQNDFALEFSVPSECARRIESGEVDLGIVPVAEIERQGLLAVPGTGIACHGGVRSILLISKVEPARIRTLAADSGSRTSVRLARVILQERFGATPEAFDCAPDLEPMLSRADAALLIGDAALKVDPAALPYFSFDLGEEWLSLTGLPMVFALWAGRPERVRRCDVADLERSFTGSLEYGEAHMEEIVAQESAARDLAPELAREYLKRHIVFRIGAREQEGLTAFYKLSAMLRSETVASL